MLESREFRVIEPDFAADSLTSPAQDGWLFQREQFLEDFVYQHLEALLNLKALSRQQIVNGQVCDILAVSQHGQPAIIELKNGEDRYVVQQLTRYYHAIQTEQPFSEQVDYRLPIRLIAILPRIHAHNQIDQTYNRLDVELYSFRIIAEPATLQFELKAEAGEPVRVLIPLTCHQYLIQEDSNVVPPLPPPPPGSFRKLIEPLSPKQQSNILRIRAQLLATDPNMGEVGRTVTTQYGLKKGDREVYQSRLLAEFSPWTPQSSSLKLCLRLPYPKRQMGGIGRTMQPGYVRGLAWGAVRLGPDRKPETEITSLSLHIGKLRHRPSQVLSLKQYGAIYQHLIRNPDSKVTLFQASLHQ